MLAGLPEEERKDAIESLMHYLASTWFSEAGTSRTASKSAWAATSTPRPAARTASGVRDGSGKMIAMVATHALKVDLKSK
ncbi:MAG: hypothetical protein U0744_14825 [Gemmataceae bacterium]